MIALLAALCLAGTPGFQGKTLLEQIVPKPTGANGYEEYLRAADIVSSANMLYWWPETIAEWQDDPGTPKTNDLAKRLKAMSVLQIRREALARFGTALNLVRQGNAKPVFYPRPSIGLESQFPDELARFKDLARLAVAAAYVYDSDGASTRATEVLLDCLVMADNISPGPRLQLLTGSAMQAMVLSAFESRLNRTSLPEALRIAAFVSDRLNRPPVVVRSFKDDAKFQLGVIDQMLTRPKEGGEALLSKEAGVAVAALTASERADLVHRVRAKYEAHVESIMLRLQGPESEWIFFDPDTPEPENEIRVSSVEELADSFFGVLILFDDATCTRAARVRTQFRLLRLAARVVAFRWQHDRLPSALADAAPAEEIADPLTGDTFQYAPMGDRFRVFSKGVKATGEIDIKWVGGRGDGDRGPPRPRG